MGERLKLNRSWKVEV